MSVWLFNVYCQSNVKALSEAQHQKHCITFALSEAYVLLGSDKYEVLYPASTADYSHQLLTSVYLSEDSVQNGFGKCDVSWHWETTMYGTDPLRPFVLPRCSALQMLSLFSHLALLPWGSGLNDFMLFRLHWMNGPQNNVKRFTQGTRGFFCGWFTRIFIYIYPWKLQTHCFPLLPTVSELLFFFVLIICVAESVCGVMPTTLRRRFRFMSPRNCSSIDVPELPLCL